MRGTEVTPEQIAHVERFLEAAGQTTAERFMMSRQNLLRLMAWYAAIRVKSGPHLLPIDRIADCEK